MKFYGEDQFNEQNSQDYNNGYYQPPLQSYDNSYYQNPQQDYGNQNYQNQQQYYNNTGYQQPMANDEFQNSNFSNQPYNRKEFLAQEREKTKQSSDASMLVKIIAIFVWFIASMVGIVVVVPQTGEPGWAIALFGQLFAVIGILVFTMLKKEAQSSPIIIFPVIGICLIIGGLAMVFGFEDFMNNLMNIMPYIIAGAFLIAGLIMVLSITITNKIKKKRCTIPVRAVILDLIPSKRRRRGRSIHGSRAYTPVYEYYYNGITYRSRDKMATNVSLPQIGQQVTAFVNPNNPEDYYVEYKGKTILTLLIAIFFVAMPAIIFFMMFLYRF